MTILDSVHGVTAESELCLRRRPQFVPLCAWIHKYLDFWDINFVPSLLLGMFKWTILIWRLFWKNWTFYNWAKRIVYMFFLPLAKQECLKNALLFLSIWAGFWFCFLHVEWIAKGWIKVDLSIPIFYQTQCQAVSDYGKTYMITSLPFSSEASGPGSLAGNSWVHSELHPVWSLFWKPQRHWGNVSSRWRTAGECGDGKELPASFHSCESRTSILQCNTRESSGTDVLQISKWIILGWKVLIPW